jgi:phage-related minor tail protein
VTTDTRQRARNRAAAYYVAHVDDVLAAARERYRADPAKGKAKSSSYYRANRERCLAQQRVYNASHREQRRRAARARKLRAYGLTIGGFERLFSRQGGACAICGVTDKRLVVDHCHTTGAVRGLLCSPCNRALGALGDDIEGLRRATEYIARAMRDGNREAALRRKEALWISQPL